MPNTCEKIQSFKVAFEKLQSEKETFEKRFFEAADAERAAIAQEVAAWKKHADEIYTSFIEFKEYTTNHYENKETLWTMDDINLWAKEQLGYDEVWVSERFTETADGIICTKLLNLDNSNITTLPACTYTERVILGNCKKLKKIHNATFTFLSINGADHVSLLGNIYGRDDRGNSFQALESVGLILDGARFDGFINFDGSTDASLRDIVCGRNGSSVSLFAASCKGLVLDGAMFEGLVSIDISEKLSLKDVVYGKNIYDNSLSAQNCKDLDIFTLTQKIPGDVQFSGSTHTENFLETIKKYKADGMIEGMLTLPDGTVIP